jgi:tetratricopeptide (TPR) repeat protein
MKKTVKLKSFTLSNALKFLFIALMFVSCTKKEGYAQQEKTETKEELKKKGDDARLKNKSYELAIGYYERALEIDPDDKFVWGDLGSSYILLKDYPQALRCYQKAIEIHNTDDPWGGTLWVGLGASYRSLKDYPQALRCFQKAIEILPNEKTAWLLLGLTYDGMKDYPQAIRCFQIVIEIDPNYRDAWYCLGLMYEHTGDRPQAISYMQKAAELGKTDAKNWLKKHGNN